MSIILRLLKALRLIKVVAMQNMHGEVYYSIKRKDPFGQNWARVSPFTAVGHVLLLDDGECGGESSYIKKWIDVA